MINDDLTTTADAPLTGVRVIDLADARCAATARYLAELGADVIRVEPRRGGLDRQLEPLVDGDSLAYLVGNTSKRGVALDLHNAHDHALLERLVATADILIETTTPGSADAGAVNVVRLRELFPSLVVLSITDFGQGGDYSGWVGSSPVMLALAGSVARSGNPGREPLLPPGDLAYEAASVQAAFVALLALTNRVDTGSGDHLDFSVLDATAQTIDPGFGIGGSATNGVPADQLPRDRPDARHMYPIFACADGYVRLCVLAPRQWQGMFAWLGSPDEFADPKFMNLQVRFAASAELFPFIEAAFANKTREELVIEGQNFGVPTAAVYSVGEAMGNEQFAARRAFIDVDVNDGLTARVANGFVEIDGRRAGVRSPAPELGEHNDEVFANLGAERVQRVVASARTAPLAGLRVLDLGVIVVGAELGRLLADQGAEVIKVENAAFPDGSRQAAPGEVISPSFAWGHRNKLGLGLNLRDEGGKELFKKLVADADIILSNFKPGTLASLGLGYDVLSAINPGIIMADSSAFGPTGPWSKRLGYGPLVRASTGLTALWSYPGVANSFSDSITIYPDHVAARVGATAVLALLLRRRRTGRGGTVSVAQAETNLVQFGALIALESIRPGSAVPLGNSSAHDAPWGLYPAAGDDEWVAITARNDAEWVALARAIDRNDLAMDVALATRAQRIARRDELDTVIADWTRARTADAVTSAVQAAGVPAGRMLRVYELPEFAYFLQRGFYREFAQEHIDHTLLTESVPVVSEHLAEPPLRSAPVRAQHTEEIAARLLGISGADFDKYLADGVIEGPTALVSA